MPLIETKGAASAQGFGLTLSSGAVNYIEDVFSTYLIKTPGSATAVGSINNAIDLSTKGGMVWLKDRSFAYDHTLVDSQRGVTQRLISNSTAAQASTSTYGFTSFNTNGFTLGAGGGALFDNGSAGTNLVTWTFRKQPKFFDIVTYTGNGSNPRNIAHNLGSTPGCIIVKALSSAGVNDWMVYHIGLGVGAGAGTRYMFLNTTGGFAASAGPWANTDATATEFTVNTWLNYSGINYVAYIFAHNAGGFGFSGSDNVISCGYYSGNGSASGPVINLGYEPQWVMIKSTNSTTATGWNIFDNMRGLVVGGSDSYLAANSSNAETAANWLSPTATGFQIVSTDNAVNNSVSNYIYIAIRRGPMKVPTSGTSVFSPVAYAGNGAALRELSVGFPMDSQILRVRNTTASDTGTSRSYFNADRLRGWPTVPAYSAAVGLSMSNSDIEANVSGPAGYMQTSFYVSDTGGIVNTNTYTFITYNFRRAPSFFDVVCYTGDGVVNRVINHNLAKTPDLIISKTRDPSGNWRVCIPAFNNQVEPNKALYLDYNLALFDSYLWSAFSSTSITVASFSANQTNYSGVYYVTYLFATCAGVSKVGSYTGTGALQTIDCGFTGGARFVLIKRTDSTGDWYVYDSARGISSGNDPYLFLNTTAAEVTGTNYVDTTSVGFQVTAAAPAGLNANGGTYIFLAIA